MSPIKNLTDIRRYPRLGKLRIGKKSISERSGKEYPDKLDHFICTDEDADGPTASAEAFRAVYGLKPRTLNVMLTSDDPEIVAPAWYRRYTSYGLACKGDGEHANESEVKGQRNEPTGQMIERDCPCDDYPTKCKQVMNLQVMIPDVEGIGVWQIDTTSFYSITNIYSMMEMIARMNGGRVHGIPLKLSVVPKQVQPSGKKVTIYCLELNAAVKLGDLKALPGAVDETKELPDPDKDPAPTELYSKTDAPEAHETVETLVLPGATTEEELCLKIQENIDRTGWPKFKTNAIKNGLDGFDTEGLTTIWEDIQKVLVDQPDGTDGDSGVPDADPAEGNTDINDDEVGEF